MTPARFRWGMILVLLGIALLLQNLDMINDNFWTDFLTYLPIFLIAVGLEKIFTKTKAQAVAYLTTVLLFAGGLYIVLSGSRGGAEENFFSQTSYEKDYDPAVKSLRASLELGHGDLTVRDATEKLVDGQFREFSEKPDIDYRVEGDEAIVKMISRASRWLGGLVKVDAGNDDWSLSFSNAVPLMLECRGDNSKVHLNLAATPVRKLTVEDDNGNIYVKLGMLVPDVDVSIAGEDADVRLRVPNTAGLTVSGVDDESYLTQLGLKSRDGQFVSEGFDTLPSRINVKLDDKVSSLNIDYY